MQQPTKSRRTLAVLGIIVFAALPQLLLYYKGYYYTTTAPAALKYPLNAGCFIIVASLGNWYILHSGAAWLAALWRIFYFIGGLFIAAEYIYHFIYPVWRAQTYLFTMGTFEGLVSPLPFIVAWLLLQWNKAFNKNAGARQIAGGVEKGGNQ